MISLLIFIHNHCLLKKSCQYSASFFKSSSEIVLTFWELKDSSWFLLATMTSNVLSLIRLHTSLRSWREMELRWPQICSFSFLSKYLVFSDISLTMKLNFALRLLWGAPTFVATDSLMFLNFSSFRFSSNCPKKFSANFLISRQIL